MPKRIIFGVVLIGAAIVVAFVLYQSNRKAQDKYMRPVEKIVLAAYEGDSVLIPYVAEKQGYFQEQGLEVEFKNFEAGKLAADALFRGEADIATASGTVFVSNSFQYPDLRILGIIAVANTNGLIARKDRGINRVKDLRGKTIGVTKKSSGEFTLGELLLFNGIKMQDMEIVDLKPHEIVKSVVSGAIDAGLTWEPNLYETKRRLGDNAIIFKKDITPLMFLLLSKEVWLKKYPFIARRFMNALCNAQSYIEKNPDEVKKYMKERFGYNQNYVISTWQDHRFVISLPQQLLLKLEDKAKWRIQNKLTFANKIPNYLDYVYLDALYHVKPESVTIIRQGVIK